MTSRLRRQQLYNMRTLKELSYSALIGKFSKDEYAAANGSLPDISYRVVFADSPILTADTENELWPVSGTEMTRTKTGELLSIVSSSIQDDSGGTGIDTIFIEGFDQNFAPQSEVVILDGTTPVSSVNNYIHVDEVNCLNTTTSGESNVGNITITGASSGDTFAYVMANDSISKHGQFLVPAGFNALLLGGAVSTYRSTGTGARRVEADLTLVPLDGGLGDGIQYRTIKVGSSSESVSMVPFDISLVIGQKILIVPTVTAEANNTLCSIFYELVLVRDTIDIDSVF